MSVIIPFIQNCLYFPFSAKINKGLFFPVLKKQYTRAYPHGEHGFSKSIPTIFSDSPWGLLTLMAKLHLSHWKMNYFEFELILRWCCRYPWNGSIVFCRVVSNHYSCDVEIMQLHNYQTNTITSRHWSGKLESLLRYFFKLPYIYKRVHARARPHSHTHTPWSTVTPVNPTGPQIVKEFPAYYGAWRFIPHSQGPATCPYPVPDPFHAPTPSRFLKILFNFILPSTPSSSNWPLYLMFSTKTPSATLVSSIRATCLAHLILLDWCVCVCVCMYMYTHTHTHTQGMNKN